MKRTAATLCFVLCLASAARSMPIGRIEVSGNFFVSEKQILQVFGLRPGDEYREDRASDGVKRLFQTKQFADLRASHRIEDGKAVVSLVVEEYPRVKEVRIQGSDKLKREDIEAKVSVKGGYFARPTLFTQDVSAILALYAE